MGCIPDRAQCRSKRKNTAPESGFWTGGTLEQGGGTARAQSVQTKRVLRHAKENNCEVSRKRGGWNRGETNLLELWEKQMKRNPYTQQM